MIRSMLFEFTYISHIMYMQQMPFSGDYFSKYKFQFSTNCQNMSCSILSQLGITNKLVHFLKGLR